MNKKNFPSIEQMETLYRKHVSFEPHKDTVNLKKNAIEWLKISLLNKIPYEVNWLGMPVIQWPEDLIIMQELIYRTKPDYIIETGIAHGGSIIYYASICELLKKGIVIGVDSEIRKHNLNLISKHPLSKRIKLIEGSSIEKETIQQIKKIIKKKKNILVILDSDHSKKHVYQELKLYTQFIRKGSYIVVNDTTAYYLAANGYPSEKRYRYDWIKNGAKNAVDEFIKTHKDFIVDPYFEKFFISASLNGFLKKI